MRKCLLTALFIIMAVSLAGALEECQRKQPQKDIPCEIITSYRPQMACGVFNLSILNASDYIIQNLTFTNRTTACNATFNLTQAQTYIWNSTIESGIITVFQEESMTSLSVALFIILVNIGLFVLPAFIRFSENKVLNNLMSKIIWMAGLLFLAFNTTIIISMADNAGLGVTQEMFIYQRLFLWAVYIGLILLFWNTIVSTLKMWRVQKIKKTMGEE